MQVQASPNSHPHRTRLSLMTKGVTHSKALRRHVDRSLNTSLGRFNRRTRDVAVWLEDVNGPRGGIDMRCRIDVRLNPRGRVSVNAQASNEYAAVVKATNRARILLDRRYKKARTRRRSHRSIRNSERSAFKHDSSNLTSTTGVTMNARKTAHNRVSIGSTIEIRDLHSNERETYTLTRPNDADITRDRISTLAPIGKAVYGRRIGDTVAVDAPGGVFHVRIESIHSGSEKQLARAG